MGVNINVAFAKIRPGRQQAAEYQHLVAKSLHDLFSPTVAPENSVQPTAKSYRQANRRPNQLGALPDLVNEIPKFTDVCT